MDPAIDLTPMPSKKHDTATRISDRFDLVLLLSLDIVACVVAEVGLLCPRDIRFPDVAADVLEIERIYEVKLTLFS